MSHRFSSFFRHLRFLDITTLKLPFRLWHCLVFRLQKPCDATRYFLFILDCRVSLLIFLFYSIFLSLKLTVALASFMDSPLMSMKPVIFLPYLRNVLVFFSFPLWKLNCFRSYLSFYFRSWMSFVCVCELWTIACQQLINVHVRSFI